MIIKIPFKTPTINHLYGQRGFHKYLTKEATQLRKEIEEIIYSHESLTSSLMIFAIKKLKVIVEIHEDWLTKKGDVKRKDVANREKFLIDSVFNALGIDDKFIYEHTMKKIQSDEEFAIIKIEEIKEDDKKREL